MSQTSECPYCGSVVRTQKAVDYDSKIKLRCSSCGGLFEYMPGFGSFSLPDQDRRDSGRYHESTQYSGPDVYGTEAPWTIERPPSEASGCNKACAILCILCFILPIISIIVFFFSILELLFGG
jgi:uncharacterized C2H2 Zn-finger protein